MALQFEGAGAIHPPQLSIIRPLHTGQLSVSFQIYLHMKDFGKNGLMAVSED